ncbi:unnamed protein product [Protopolystoma xenopodis]|uniref:Zinc finger PHD-type domain-containing protein n=1 Tax=Protopolystoma xenopodis TaxID=117903 RepID=A0A3S5B1S9_9PLAT|nr:unnamed protein product [Protopolystoma xenopodis]
MNEASQPDECSWLIDVRRVEPGLIRLDAALDMILSVFEAYAGRRSWLGRRLATIRLRYSQLRTEFLAELESSTEGSYALSSSSIPNLSLQDPYAICPLIAKAVIASASGPGTKKKADRRALDRGAEVIRCLCGFRVEGGHVMVQCDRCAAWQHLPCLWWALSLKAVKLSATESLLRPSG